MLASTSVQSSPSKEYTKKIFVKTTTTKPPIVWFPGDPDCGEGDVGGNAQIDTFQLIAFLLSVFNVAAIMVSNVNNNNNNNNINDNTGNANDNNINESNTNAEVSSMSMVGLGGRSLERSRRAYEVLAEENLDTTVWDMMKMMMKSHVTRSISCLEKLFCKTNQETSARGGFSSVTAEMSSLLIAKNLPKLSENNRKRLILSGKYGRSGLDCDQLYEQCEEENENFANIAEAFTWSSVASFDSLTRLVDWAHNK